jgi:RHS repeat-associated protein
MKTKLTLALMALITGSAFGSMPKVLPEFKNEKQLAEWRDEMAAKHATTTTATGDHAFYTGKPYIESTGNYAFKYRSYNPELARWTSEDPSGFPDGANAYCYVENQVNNMYDWQGLAKEVIKTRYEVTVSTDYYFKSYAEVTGYAGAGGAATGLGIAAIVSNPAGWVVGVAVGGGLTVGATYVYGVGLSEAGNKAREEYPMWSGNIGGGEAIDSGTRMSVADDFTIRNYVTGYDPDGRFGSDGFKYSMIISYDHYVSYE